MLRITRVESASGTLLRLEGRIVGEWVAVLQEELESSSRGGQLPELDLAGVEFANDAGVRALQEAAELGARIRACSPLLASLLGERPK
ncbi:MAG: hypothetical protein QM756_15350 [Polyangiaceae bacterium]